MADKTQDHWMITPMALTELINNKRKALNKSSIDHATVMTRLVLKSNVAYPSVFDFEAPELKMDAEQIAIMEQLLNDQFGLYMERKLSRSCKFKSSKKQQEAVASRIQPAPPQMVPEKSGITSMIGRLFGR